MYAAYLFSVVLGGGLLLLSVLGDILGGDTIDVEIDLDADTDLALDADSDMDGSASKILSIRTVVYALFGFGAVGTLLTKIGFVAAAPTTIAYAAIGGLVSGAMVQKAFAYLRRTESGLLESDDSYIGLPATVTLPLGGGSAGNIAVQRGDRRHTLRALPHASVDPDAVPEGWKSVVVVEMKDGVAYVAPTEGDLDALP